MNEYIKYFLNSLSPSLPLSFKLIACRWQGWKVKLWSGHTEHSQAIVKLIKKFKAEKSILFSSLSMIISFTGLGSAITAIFFSSGLLVFCIAFLYTSHWQNFHLNDYKVFISSLPNLAANQMCKINVIDEKNQKNLVGEWHQLIAGHLLNEKPLIPMSYKNTYWKGHNRAFPLMSCCPPTWPSDCADWPGYPRQSRAPCAHTIIVSLNHEWRSSWRNRYALQCKTMLA